MLFIGSELVRGGSSDWDKLFVNVGSAVSTDIVVSIAEIFSLTVATSRSSVEMGELGLVFTSPNYSMSIKLL